MPDPPYRIVTPRLVLRCWEPADAALLKDAVDSSLGHLRPWLPWTADEPQPLETKVALLRRFRGQFDLGRDFVYGIFSADESEVVGGTGLHTRVGDDAFEIGYWIRASRAREGLATEASAALTRAAFEICNVDRVEIRVDPANVASLGIPRRLGFHEEATLRRRLDGKRDVVVWVLFADEAHASRIGETPYDAFDAAGAPLT